MFLIWFGITTEDKHVKLLAEKLTLSNKSRRTVVFRKQKCTFWQITPCINIAAFGTNYWPFQYASKMWVRYFILTRYRRAICLCNCILRQAINVCFRDLIDKIKHFPRRTYCFLLICKSEKVVQGHFVAALVAIVIWTSNSFRMQQCLCTAFFSTYMLISASVSGLFYKVTVIKCASPLEYVFDVLSVKNTFAAYVLHV